MKWITREGVKVDRVACPWLIQRFIDPEAEFLFAPAAEVRDRAEREGATPYDIPDVELGHHGERCSFDAFIEKYGLTDAALGRLRLIVRGADTSSYGIAPEAAGLAAMAEGFRASGRSDHELLVLEFPVYDALYAYCQR